MPRLGTSSRFLPHRGISTFGGQLGEASVLDISTAVDIARHSVESRHLKIYGVAVVSRREIHVYFTSPSDVVVAYLEVKRIHNKWQKGEQVIWTA